MSNINFKLRKLEGVQTIYFRYRPNRQLDITLATPYSINAKDWDSVQQNWNERQIVAGAKSIEAKRLNETVKSFNRSLSDFKNKIERLAEQHLDKTGTDFKVILKDFIQENYFAHRIVKKNADKNTTVIPDNFQNLIDYYIQFRSIEDITQGTKPLAPNTVKKLITLKNHLKQYNKNLNATEVDDSFRNIFIQHLNNKVYSEAVKVKFLKNIKMLCVFASKELEVSKQVLHWIINPAPKNVSEYPSLTLEEVERLTSLNIECDKLQKVRDWFLISFYTSARVSELMEMTIDNIQKDGEDYYIFVLEEKNKNKKSGEKLLYMMPEAIQILNKRNGQFPKKFSHQKYNEYLKDLFKIGEFSRLVKCAPSIETEFGFRRVETVLPLHDAISSHCGRTTYVTLYSEKLPVEIIQIQTNHQSLEMVEHYNKTEKNEKLLRKAKLVAQAHRVAEANYRRVELKIKL